MIDSRAIIDPKAKLADDVQVGPWTIIGPDVEIGSGSVIASHCVIKGPTIIGRNNRIFQFSSVGEDTPDMKYKGEATRLEIGDDNTFREFCTLNRGTTQDAGVTRVGSNNWIMAYVHMAHDCQVGSHTIFANNAQIAGHVHVGDHVILGGFTVVHQFCRIGAHSMTAMGTILLQDLPPYVMASGNTAVPHGINSEGLRRRGFSAPAIAAIKRAYKTIYKSGLSFEEARVAIVAEAGEFPELQALSDFLSVPGRGIIR